MSTNPQPCAWALQGTQHIETVRQGYHDGNEWVPLFDGAALDAAVAAERERCAKVCEEQAAFMELSDAVSRRDDAAKECAEAIRRG